MGRPRKYPDANARQEAFKQSHAQIGVLLDPDKKARLEEIAKHHNVSLSTLCRAMLTHSLATHNWRSEMLWKDAK